ncbi:hypothetical protein M406DRAFT_103037 [Cryphonectria parasitica EP155]|uniref:Uncharacterized protein n=1 Tax=Cryphonectria parasitica (strain ATCC 38755 / EP155) TaxID=660469 RepID=A0A9P5CSD8_CRYP1|nr:uncharacterized protein M406DRAFT_103037 [Cryphonectria parasitica EP155]KAF3769203.1 hypothetical protein M406DRAFT_103037 [Cryphonectria parasitica EP155]
MLCGKLSGFTFVFLFIVFHSGIGIWERVRARDSYILEMAVRRYSCCNGAGLVSGISSRHRQDRSPELLDRSRPEVNLLHIRVQPIRESYLGLCSETTTTTRMTTSPSTSSSTPTTVCLAIGNRTRRSGQRKDNTLVIHTGSHEQKW